MFFTTCGLLAMSFAPAEAAIAQIKGVAMNILAPVWCAPSSYPTQSQCAPYITSGPDFLNTNWRRPRILSVLMNNVTNADFLALQETQVSENQWLRGQLKKNWFYFEVYHDITYWSSYSDACCAFSPNGVSIAISTAKYSNCTAVDADLTTGNHAVIASCTHKATGKKVVMVSAHLDSDTGGKRGKEANALADALNAIPADLQFIGGDLNADTDSGVLKSRLVDTEGFKDVLRDTGNGDKITHPWSNTYNSNSMWGAIDHIMVRGNNAASISSKIHDGDLFLRFPDGVNGNEIPRICTYFEKAGTDHFAVEGVVQFSY